MSTVQLRHHRSSSTLLHLFMGLVAGLLALAAVYLWLTDDDISPISLPEPTAAAPPAEPSLAPPVAPVSMAPASIAPAPLAQPQAAAPSAPGEPVHSTAIAAGPLQPQPYAAPAGPDPAAIQPPPAQAQGLDPQVAADAAAAGMTTRVRPAQPAHSAP